MKALFIGMYPNVVSPYRNVFFQNLIFAMADHGVDCTVVSPVPITKYGKAIRKIAYETIHVTAKGNKIRIFYPRYVSVSSKQIGRFNTERLSEKWFEDSAMKTVKRISNEFDFVYGHFFLYGGLAAIRIGKYLSIPVFLAYGECDFESQVKSTYGFPKKEQLEGLTGIISVSTKNTYELKELGIVPDIPVLMAPNSIDLTLFFKKDKDECRSELDLPLDKFIVGFVGGFIERKGDKRLLAAIEQLDNVYVAFAGHGGNPPKGDKVLFCQSLDHERMPVFLNAIDVFCLPTLSEGSCNAIIEAMACGLPIVSSNLPFNDDVLTDDNSIRIDPKSIEQIKGALETLYNDEKKRYSLSKAALEQANNFEIGKRAINIINFIKDKGKI